MDYSYSINVDKLLTFSDELLDCLKDMKDLNSLDKFLKHSASLQSSCESDNRETLSSIQEYQKQINACKQQCEKTKSEVGDDSEISPLERELADEEKREQLAGEELRYEAIIVEEFAELERQRVSVEEQKKKLLEAQDEKRVAAMLSFYASVTKIIPDLDDKSKISGHLVDRDSKIVQKFELDPAKQTSFDTCNIIWKTIDMCL